LQYMQHYNSRTRGSTDGLRCIMCGRCSILTLRAV
jgi:hypothetical protein